MGTLYPIPSPTAVTFTYTSTRLPLMVKDTQTLDVTGMSALKKLSVDYAQGYAIGTTHVAPMRHPQTAQRGHPFQKPYEHPEPSMLQVLLFVPSP